MIKKKKVITKKNSIINFTCGKCHRVITKPKEKLKCPYCDND